MTARTPVPAVNKDALWSGARVVLAGIGSAHRRDDGAGPLVAARASELAGVACDVGPVADPLDLLGHWDDADLAVVVDTTRSGVAPGTLRVLELGEGGDAGPCTPGGSGTTSTHGIGLTGVLRLARAVGNAPGRVVVVGIEGHEFGMGTGLSPAVEAAVPEAVRAVLALIEEVHACA